MTRRFGWTPDPARMQIVPDVMTGIVEVLRALAPGAGVVINPPVYPPFFPGIAEAGCKVVEVPLAGDELDLDGIDRAFAGGARALLLCNPHNPTGRVLAPIAWRTWPRSPPGTTRSSWPTRSTGR